MNRNNMAEIPDTARRASAQNPSRPVPAAGLRSNR